MTVMPRYNNPKIVRPVPLLADVSNFGQIRSSLAG
jgi:hypothetical protein